jgi:hypothetical protein
VTTTESLRRAQGGGEDWLYCRACSTSKPPDAFYVSPDGGRYGPCRDCRCARQRERYAQRQRRYRDLEAELNDLRAFLSTTTENSPAAARTAPGHGFKE